MRTGMLAEGSAQTPAMSSASVLGLWCVALASTVPVFRILPFTNQWILAVMALPFAVVALGAARRPFAGAIWPFCMVFVGIGTWTSSGFSGDPDQHWVIGGQLLVWFAVGPYAARGLFLMDVRIIRRSCVGLTLVQSASAVAGLGQAFLGWSIGDQQAEFGRAPGLAGHPNILGLMSGIAVVLCVVEILNHDRWKFWAIPLAVINVGGLLASGSISALIAFGLGILTLLAAKRVRVRVVAAVLGAAGLVGWIVAAVISATGNGISVADRIRQVTGQTTAISTLELRENTISYAWERIQADPWFGVGLDDYSGATYNGATVTHNVILRAWFQGGLAVGIAFLLLFGVFASLVVRSIVRASNGSAAAVVVVVGGFAMTAASFQQGYFWVPMLGALSVYAPLVSRSSFPKRRDLRFGRSDSSNSEIKW